MKHLKITFLLLATLCLTFSCSSDDDGGSGSVADLIVGTWVWTSSTFNGQAETLTECDLMDTFTLTSGGEFTSTTHESNTGNAPCEEFNTQGTYTVSGNQLSTVFGSETFAITVESVNSSTLVLREEDGGDVYVDVYTRQ